MGFLSFLGKLPLLFFLDCEPLKLEKLLLINLILRLRLAVFVTLVITSIAAMSSPVK